MLWSPPPPRRTTRLWITITGERTSAKEREGARTSANRPPTLRPRPRPRPGCPEPACSAQRSFLSAASARASIQRDATRRLALPVRSLSPIIGELCWPRSFLSPLVLTLLRLSTPSSRGLLEYPTLAFLVLCLCLSFSHPPLSLSLSLSSSRESPVYNLIPISMMPSLLLPNPSFRLFSDSLSLSFSACLLTCLPACLPLSLDCFYPKLT